MASRKPRAVHPDAQPEPMAPAQMEAEGTVGVMSEADLKAKAMEMAERLDAMARSLVGERADAIRYRSSSGIEQDWIEDEEHHDGIDDANRDEHSSAWRTRPAGKEIAKKKGRIQSSVFLNITRPAVNIAAARVCNILMPRFNLSPTPVPELIGIANGELPTPMLNQISDSVGNDPTAAADLAEAAVREAMRVMDESKARASKAQKRVEDWHVEGKYYAQNRLMIKDAAKVGSGVLKGPIPEKIRRVAYKDGTLVVSEETKPITRRVDYWNCYPAADCGENIQAGSYHWEKDAITAKKLRQLKGGDYLDDQIDLALKEGPMRAIAPTKYKQNTNEPGKGPFEIWFRYGDLTKENLEAAGCECPEGVEVSLPALLTMVNEHVIKVTRNPLDSGAFPYDYFAWPQKRKGMPWGTGISRAGRTPQRIVAAAVRVMMDNAGRSAGPQVIKGTQIQPNDGVNEIVPWKLWDYAEDGDIDDVRKAFAFVEVPMRQIEMANIIQMGVRWMEESTNMPALLQGQQGSAPDLVGVVEILNANAGEFLRDLGASYDDDVSEPHGQRYYEWLLQYGQDDEKGEFVLDTRGASVNVERLLQDQELLKAMQMSLNPVFKKDPAKFMDEYLTSRHFDPTRFDYDDEEWQKIVANMQKGDPRVAVAQLRAELEQKLQQTEQAFESQENDLDRQNKLMLAAIDAELGQAGLSVETRKVLEGIRAKLDDNKVKLADTVIKLRGQQQMQREANAREALRPPTEPRGRAKPGRAFTQ